MFPTQEITRIRRDTYASQPDLIITHCVRVLKYHIVPHKYVKFIGIIKMYINKILTI